MLITTNYELQLMLTSWAIRTVNEKANKNQHELDREANAIGVVVGICKEDNPADVDEAYGPGTYRRLFPDDDENGGNPGPLERMEIE